MTGERIVEPQLPVYAAYAGAASAVEPHAGERSSLPCDDGREGPHHVAAVAFAKVREDGCAFVGLGEVDGLLPGVTASEDWPATLEAWRQAIAAVATEILAGDASVRYLDDRLLEYCDVLPLLRLPERRSQMERT